MSDNIAMPPVPLTVEGASVLHQMMRVRWADWRKADRGRMLPEAAAVLAEMEQAGSGVFSLLGHKGDLMLVHFRNSFAELDHLQRQLRKLALFDYFEPTTSYVSMVELGLYESTQKVYSSLADRGIHPHTPEWDAGIEEALNRSREAMRPRLWPSIPDSEYLCFYPMDRRRGEHKNWYQETMRDRARMMDEHGRIGRRYAGTVKQIITGSIGFDDWEWGVDLFADDPLVFKKLIYEMRFDEVSAVYALFGTFYIGRRVRSDEFTKLLAV